MEIKITGHHLEVTQGLEDHIKKKSQKARESFQTKYQILKYY